MVGTIRFADGAEWSASNVTFRELMRRLAETSPEDADEIHSGAAMQAIRLDELPEAQAERLERALLPTLDGFVRDLTAGRLYASLFMTNTADHLTKLRDNLQKRLT